MNEKSVFLLDGNAYNLEVIKLTRGFAVLDTAHTGRTMDGTMYREPVGTLYHYTMTLRAREGCYEDLDRFWSAVSRPVVSHICTFPYGQSTLTQKMYITEAEQPLMYTGDRENQWGEVCVRFHALRPMEEV